MASRWVQSPSLPPNLRCSNLPRRCSNLPQPPLPLLPCLALCSTRLLPATALDLRHITTRTPDDHCVDYTSSDALHLFRRPTPSAARHLSSPRVRSSLSSAQVPPASPVAPACLPLRCSILTSTGCGLPCSAMSLPSLYLPRFDLGCITAHTPDDHSVDCAPGFDALLSIIIFYEN